MTDTPDYPFPPDELLTHLRAGTYNKQVTDILDAVKFQMAGGAFATRWRLQLLDMDVTEDSITVGELERIEKATGVNWLYLRPGPTGNVTGEMLRVLLQTRRGMTPEEAEQAVLELTAGELTGCVTEYTVEPAPKGTAT